MKKIFAMMTILALFAIACSADQKAEDRTGPGGIDGVDDNVNDALNEAHDKIGDTDDFTQYTQIFVNEDSYPGVTRYKVIYLNDDKTQMKETYALTFTGEEYGVIYNNEVVSQGAYQYKLANKEGTLKNEAGEEIKYADKEYTLYEQTTIESEYKNVGDWVPGDISSYLSYHYLIKETDNKLYMFEVDKRQTDEYTLSGDDDIVTPSEYETYIKK